MFASYRALEMMTAAEQASLPRATARHSDPREDVLYSMALSPGPWFHGVK